MNEKNVGFLHPGEMGITLAVTVQNSGFNAYWAAAGRSHATRRRATENDLIEVPGVAELCRRCDIVISVCPPHAALDVARQVLATSFKGLYADANAISPQHAREIGRLMSDAGVTFVDGGIIGGPAWTAGTTWLYLAGSAAPQVAAVFAAGPLETEIMGDEIGQASALKMCFAANSKGTTALLCAVVAAAEGLGVRPALEKHWSRHDSPFAQQTYARIRNVTRKAWRFSGEMDEIAATFAGAGLPAGFHGAAGDIYRRLAGFKESTPLPPLEDVLAALLGGEEEA